MPSGHLANRCPWSKKLSSADRGDEVRCPGCGRTLKVVRRNVLPDHNAPFPNPELTRAELQTAIAILDEWCAGTTLSTATAKSAIRKMRKALGASSSKRGGA